MKQKVLSYCPVSRRRCRRPIPLCFGALVCSGIWDSFIDCLDTAAACPFVTRYNQVLANPRGGHSSNQVGLVDAGTFREWALPCPIIFKPVCTAEK
jgi:hypothetical protein